MTTPPAFGKALLAVVNAELAKEAALFACVKAPLANEDAEFAWSYAEFALAKAPLANDCAEAILVF